MKERGAPQFGRAAFFVTVTFGGRARLFGRNDRPHRSGCPAGTTRPRTGAERYLATGGQSI